MGNITILQLSAAKQNSLKKKSNIHSHKHTYPSARKSRAIYIK